MRTRRDFDGRERRAYLWGCIRISLAKRWAWVVLVGTAVLLAAFVGGASLVPSAAAAVLAAAGASAWIAWSSYRRHRDDVPRGAPRKM